MNTREASARNNYPVAIPLSTAYFSRTERLGSGPLSAAPNLELFQILTIPAQPLDFSRMGSSKSTGHGRQLNERLATSGFRFTPQRQHVYDVLLQKRDHPTVEEVFIRAKQGMPDISMATVYNCLDALVKCGLIRHVNLDRAATRYCPNMKEHSHFYCDECGGVFDVDFSTTSHHHDLKVPAGFKIKQFDVSIRGLCRDCANGRRKH
jgi:Fur family transcriptional regulator, peroxide stress response regulator